MDIEREYEKFISGYSQNTKTKYRMVLRTSGLIPFIKSNGKEITDWSYEDIQDFMINWFGLDENGNPVLKGDLVYTNRINTIGKFLSYITGNKKISDKLKNRAFRENYMKRLEKSAVCSFDQIRNAAGKLTYEERIYFLTMAKMVYLGGNFEDLLSVAKENINKDEMELQWLAEGRYIQLDQEMIDLLEKSKDIKSIGRSSYVIPMIDGGIFGLSVRSLDKPMPKMNLAIKRLSNIYNRLLDKCGLNVSLREVKQIGILDTIEKTYPEEFDRIFTQDGYGKAMRNEIMEIALDYEITERTFKSVFSELQKIYDMRKI